MELLTHSPPQKSPEKWQRVSLTHLTFALLQLLLTYLHMARHVIVDPVSNATELYTKYKVVSPLPEIFLPCAC